MNFILQPNNQFSVKMEGFGSDTFDLSPRGGLGSTVLSLAVKKEANLDYEKEEFRRLEFTVSYAVKSKQSLIFHYVQ